MLPLHTVRLWRNETRILPKQKKSRKLRNLGNILAIFERIGHNNTAVYRRNIVKKSTQNSSIKKINAQKSAENHLDNAIYRRILVVFDNTEPSSSTPFLRNERAVAENLIKIVS